MTAPPLHLVMRLREGGLQCGVHPEARAAVLKWYPDWGDFPSLTAPHAACARCLEGALRDRARNAPRTAYQRMVDMHVCDGASIRIYKPNGECRDA